MKLLKVICTTRNQCPQIIKKKSDGPQKPPSSLYQDFEENCREGFLEELQELEYKLLKPFIGTQLGGKEYKHGKKIPYSRKMLTLRQNIRIKCHTSKRLLSFNGK